MKVLLAVDGSDYTQKMLDYLVKYDELLGREDDYTVLSVEPVLPPRARGALGKNIVDQYYSDEASRVLEPAVSFLRERGHLNVTKKFEVGQPGETIARFATDGEFDLIVMGSHGHGRILNLVMGSVTTAVLKHCHVPVLLVR
ncbi:MAG: universal stress protein [Burkholderiales bacterium]